MKFFRILPVIVLTIFELVMLNILNPALAEEWTWSYTGEGVEAHGSFTTTDTPNEDGFYQITAISGEHNGENISQLQPNATGIPGNGDYVVDNLIRSEFPQLTINGFGYVTSQGQYANPFYIDSGYLTAISLSEQAQSEEIKSNFTAIRQTNR